MTHCVFSAGTVRSSFVIKKLKDDWLSVASQRINFHQILYNIFLWDTDLWKTQYSQLPVNRTRAEILSTKRLAIFYFGYQGNTKVQIRSCDLCWGLIVSLEMVIKLYLTIKKIRRTFNMLLFENKYKIWNPYQ